MIGELRIRFRLSIRDRGLAMLFAAHRSTSRSIHQSSALLRRIASFNDHVLDHAAAGAAECGCFLVLGGFEARDSLLERRELDHDEAIERFRTFVDSIPAATGEDGAPVAIDDLRDAVCVLLV